MRKYKSPNNPFKSDGFSLRENNLVTKVYQVQGLDLVIEQTDRNKETVYLSHYSNPGTAFFTGLLKFLYVNRLPIPKIQEPNSVHDEFRTSARWIGIEFACARFPLTYKYHLADYALAIMQPFYEEFKPLLEIKVSDGTIVIYPRMAQKLITNIPLIYPRLDSFNIAYKEFLREAQKYPEQLVPNIPIIRMRHAQQLEFEFMEKLRNGKRK